MHGIAKRGALAAVSHGSTRFRVRLETPIIKTRRSYREIDASRNFLFRSGEAEEIEVTVDAGVDEVAVEPRGARRAGGVKAIRLNCESGRLRGAEVISQIIDLDAPVGRHHPLGAAARRPADEAVLVDGIDQRLVGSANAAGKDRGVGDDPAIGHAARSVDGERRRDEIAQPAADRSEIVERRGALRIGGETVAAG